MAALLDARRKDVYKRQRVDFSGRSVIAVGPTLKMYQCGVPREMAIELFKPFVMREIVARDIVQNVKAAKRLVERGDERIGDILEEVIKMCIRDRRNTIEKDIHKNPMDSRTDEALKEIYERLRPGEPKTAESSRSLLVARFFDPHRYDLAAVGRYKINKKLNIKTRLLNQTIAEPLVDLSLIHISNEVSKWSSISWLE